jgi:tetratricopeptide (TPR) repeat protein
VTGGRAVSATAPHIVGRERELAELATVLARTDQTRGCAVVVTGPAGSGRTTMLRLAADSRTDGATVVAARCHPEESGLAFGVAIELVRGVLAAAPEALPQLASPVRAELARLVPETAELVGPAVAGEDPAAPARLYAAVRSLLAAVGGAVHLSIDDAHWLDRASAELLAYLVRRLDGVPLTIVVSWGTDVPVAPVPLSTALSDAVAAGGGAELRLAPLSADDVAQLVGDDPRLRGVDPQRVATATGGLPALVTAWLEAVRRAGPQDESVTDPSAPDAVEDLLRRRITLLSETTQQVLAAAAALGGRVPPEVLRDVSGRGEAETVAAVEEALLAGALVEVAPGGDYDVAFESLRRVVLSSTTVARQRLLHRRAAAALARRGSGRVTPALAGAVAHHLAAGGREAQAAQWHWRAALEARALHAHDEALAAVRAAVALGHPAAPARVTEGEILIALGRYREALGALELAAAASEPATPEAARVERRLADVHHRLGDYAVADVHLSAALEQAGEAGMSPADLAVMEAERALLAHRLGRREQARCLAAAARQRAGDGVAAAYALNVSGVVATGDGDVDLAEQLFRDSLAASGRAPTDDIAIAALNNLARLLSGAGRHDEALAAAEEALRRGREVGDRHRLAALHTNLADLLRATGDDDAAIAHLKEAAAMFATVDDEQQRRPEIWKLVEW